MGRLTNLNPAAPIADADLPASIARDAEFIAADTAHRDAADPHLQYPTQARGDARYVRKYSQSFRAAPKVSQPLLQNTPTKIILSEVTTNIGNQFANSRLLALDTEETWRFNINVNFVTSVTTRITLSLYKNGAAFLDSRLRDWSCFSGYDGLTITTEVKLLAGEYVEFFARIFDTGACSVYGDSDLNACWVRGARVG